MINVNFELRGDQITAEATPPPPKWRLVPFNTYLRIKKKTLIIDGIIFLWYIYEDQPKIPWTGSKEFNSRFGGFLKKKKIKLWANYSLNKIPAFYGRKIC